MPGRSNRQVLILTVLAAAGLALFMFLPSVGRPERNSAFDSLQGDAAARVDPVVASTPVSPAPEAGTAPLVGSAVPSFSAGDMLGLAFRLLIVGAIIVGSLFLLKLYGQRFRTISGGSGVIRVLDTVGLAAGRVIYALDVGEKVLLVGATQSQISYLGEVTGKETISALRAAVERPGGRGPGLGDALRGLTARFAAGGAPDRQAVTAPITLRQMMEGQAHLRARLHEMDRRYHAGPEGER